LEHEFLPASIPTVFVVAVSFTKKSTNTAFERVHFDQIKFPNIFLRLPGLHTIFYSSPSFNDLIPNTQRLQSTNRQVTDSEIPYNKKLETPIMLRDRATIQNYQMTSSKYDSGLSSFFNTFFKYF